MKFRYFLVEEIERLRILAGLEYVRWTVKDEKLKFRCAQLKRITRDLEILLNKENVSVKIRLNYILNGPKTCEVCDNKYATPTETCSISCASKLKHINESPEAKVIRGAKSSAARDYKSIHKKRAITMRADIVDGVNAFGRANEKAIATMRDDVVDGINMLTRKGILASRSTDYQAASKKAIATMKQRGKNSSKTYWDNISDEDKITTLAIRADKALQTKINNGNAMPLHIRDPYNTYVKAAAFTHGFATTDISQIELLSEHGVFNNKSNTKGCVRDHLLSRRYGFDNGINPAIIAHPANCEIVLHSENVKRANGDDNQITLEELKNRIKSFEV